MFNFSKYYNIFYNIFCNYCFKFLFSEYIIRYFAGFFAFSIFCFVYGYYKKITNNLNSLNDFKKETKYLICKNYIRDCSGEIMPLFEKCFFKNLLLEEKGFKLIKKIKLYEKEMIIYKNNKNHI